MNLLRNLSVLGATILLVACGGTVETVDDGTGGTGGTGGTTNTGGSNTGGTGYCDPSQTMDCANPCTGFFEPPVCRNGQWVCDVACADAGTTCAPLPDCNWCGGTTVYDTNGCGIGYMCNNGADPCATNPCDPDDFTSCPTGTTCATDGLCWTGSPCSEKACTVTPIWGCDCDWSCPDGNDYGTRCVPTGSGGESCECLINGEVAFGCATQGGGAGGPGDWCGASTCCDFPQ
jgi:hypothetical protein